MIPPHPDKLIINGQTLPLAYSHTCPAKYLQNRLPSVPGEHLTLCSPMRVSDSPREMQATWEIKPNGNLYLVALNSTAFKLDKKIPLPADWVYGVIHLPGKQKIRIKQGIVVKHSLLDFLSPIWK